MARARLHLALCAEDAGRLRGHGRGAAVRGARRAGRRSQGVPVRRGAQGRAQALGVQGVRHRVHARDADLHLHGVAGGRLRRVLQLRPDEPPAGARGDLYRAEPAMTTGRAERSLLPTADREQQVLDRIERARRRRPKLREERITMSHGSGGKATHTLIEAVFLEAFRNPLLEPLEDAARLPVPGGAGTTVPLTTDSFVVSPLFFPGGNIGDLAVNGTVNDLAVAGATPLYLTAGFILEEGFPVADLTRITESMRDAAAAAGVAVVTGDTKVVERGKADGCYINTAGVGTVPAGVNLGVAQARPGDAILVSGPIGDHGVTIMLARGELDIEADVESDTASLADLVAGLLSAVPGVRALRDATRGGVATILNEIAKAADVGVLA